MTPRTRTLTPAAPSPAGPRVRGIGLAGASVELAWDVRPVYDFVFSLSDEVGLTEDLPARDRRWLADAKAEVAAQALGGKPIDGDLMTMLAMLAVDRAEVRTAREFASLVRAADPLEIRRLALSEALRDPSCRDAAERVLAGDESAVDQLCADLPAEYREKSRLLITRTDEAHAEAVRVLEAWLPRYETIEPRITAMQARDVEDRATDIATLGIGDLIEKTTGGVRWVSDPGVRRVILVPSYFSRPYNFTLIAEDWRLFAYPIADTAVDGGDPDAPPQRLVRLNRALGDESRLRILRMLRERDLYLTEIAQALELSKPTAKHHLAQLRAAGLITMTEEGGYTYYSLRRERLREATVDLERYLG